MTALLFPLLQDWETARAISNELVERSFARSPVPPYPAPARSAASRAAVSAASIASGVVFSLLARRHKY
ncbi:MAG: hypothetical protein AAFX40_13910, partial [Cyanobacteria bacterium J06639_1]